MLCRGSQDFLLSQTDSAQKQKIIDLNRASDLGFLDRSEYISLIAEELDVGSDFIETAMRTRHHRNEALIQFAWSLKNDYKIGLLSNVGTGVVEGIFTEHELSTLFDTVVLSGQVGMEKPYFEIFELTAARLRVEKSECIMIDDIETNIDGARSTGMEGLLYYDNEQFETDFRKAIQHY